MKNKFILMPILFALPFFSYSKEGEFVGKMEGWGKELREKEKTLELREIQLNEREGQIALAEDVLEGKIKNFQNEQNKILNCLEENNKDKQKRADHLVDVISGMRSLQAAKVLSVQDIEISVQILDRLPAKKASRIFNLMNKDISARIQKQFFSMKK